jgi:hypothetical protein
MSVGPYETTWLPLDWVFMKFDTGVFFENRSPVAALSKALVFGRSPAEIVGSNSTGSMDVCLSVCECCVCCQVEVCAMS